MKITFHFYLLASVLTLEICKSNLPCFDLGNKEIEEGTGWMND